MIWKYQDLCLKKRLHIVLTVLLVCHNTTCTQFARMNGHWKAGRPTKCDLFPFDSKDSCLSAGHIYIRVNGTT